MFPATTHHRPACEGTGPPVQQARGEPMSVVTENHTTQFNATLSPSHEDFLKKRELGGGFYQTEDIHEAGADAHSSHSGEMSRLLVWSTERSALVSRKELSVVAVSLRPAASYTTGQETRAPE